MNSSIMPSRVQVEPALLQRLVAETKETIAPGFSLVSTARPAFKAINLWNIRRKAKYAHIGMHRNKSIILSLTHVSF